MNPMKTNKKFGRANRAKRPNQNVPSINNIYLGQSIGKSFYIILICFIFYFLFFMYWFFVMVAFGFTIV